MATPIKIFRGDTFSGVVTLRVLDSCDGAKQNPYPIVANSLIEVHFPGISPAPSVVLSTANPGEITIINAADGSFSYKGSPAKSALINKANLQPMTVVVTTPGGTVTTWQLEKILNVYDRANP
jgi:hypothetical protein